MGQFGGFNAGANVGLPGAGLSSGNDFCRNVLIGVGILTLVNTVATVAVPFYIVDSIYKFGLEVMEEFFKIGLEVMEEFFTELEALEPVDAEETEEAHAIRKKNYDMIKENVLKRIQHAAQKYA